MIKTLNIPQATTDMKIDFPIPIVTGGLMIEYANFYESIQALHVEKLTCPRCKIPVNDKICPNCRENVYQCRQCRNINYDNPDAFLCNDCGHCKWARFEFHVTAKTSFGSHPIQDDQDRERALETIRKESENAQQKHQQLLELKKPLVKLISLLHDADMPNESLSPSGLTNKKVTILASLYEKECKSIFDGLTKSIQILKATRHEIIKHSNKHAPLTRVQQNKLDSRSNTCFGCATSFVFLSLEVFDKISQKQLLIEQGILEELLENNLHFAHLYWALPSEVDVTEVICKLTEDNPKALSLVYDLINKKLEYALNHYKSLDFGSFIGNEIALLTESCYLVDSIWDQRLRIVLDLFFKSVKLGWSIPVICDHVILPLLSVLTEFSVLPQEVLSGMFMFFLVGLLIVSFSLRSQNCRNSPRKEKGIFQI